CALSFPSLFGQGEGTADAAAIFAAIAFAWSTFMTVFLYYSTASVMSFLPAAAYAVARRNAVFMALVVATLMANGHPESVFHIAIGCAVLLLLNGFSREPIIGAIFGLAISAPAWVPALEQIPLSARYA